MIAKEFAEKYPSCFNLFRWENWWIESVRANVLDFTVNYFLLLSCVPLWRFNELYTKWYREWGGEGSMGDFLEDIPNDEKIAEICGEIIANGWDKNLK